jgi:hypothetical protein
LDTYARESFGSLDLSRRFFDFAPVILPLSVVQLFDGPDALRMCKAKVTPCDPIPLGDVWTAVRQDGPWAEVIGHPSNTRGYLYLPDLDRIPNDISDFAAGLLSYQRGDYGQAIRLLIRVASRTSSQTSTRQDAEVLAIIARARAGNNVSRELEG